MGQLVFQATLGGQVNLVGPNTASTFNINVPAFAGTMASLASVTTNGVTYVNSSGQPTTGTALTFDGTNFATTGTATATKLIPTGSSVTGNGLYLPAANALGLSTNGTNAVYIDSSQNVGIGGTPFAYGAGYVDLWLQASTTPVLDLAVGSTRTGTFFASSTAVNFGTVAAVPLILNTANTERMRIDSSGNVGIATSSPLAGSNLSINGSMSLIPSYSTYLTNSYYNGAWKYAGNGVAWGIGNNFGGVTNGVTIAVASVNAGGAGAALTWNPAFNIDSTGNVGIGLTPATGTTSNIQSSGDLTLYGGSRGFLGNVYYQSAWKYAGTGYGWGWIDSGSGNITFQSTSSSGTAGGAATLSERMRIDSSGNLLVGTTVGAGTSGSLLYLKKAGGTAWQVGPATTGSGNTFYVLNSSDTGVSLASGNTAWTANSDERLKTDLVPIENAASKVCSLRAVTGRFKTDEVGTSRAFLIAQDVQAVLPEAVNATDPDKLGVQYTDVIPLLVAAIKEQQALITQLQADVAALKSK